MNAIALIGVVALIACGPGPLPEIPGHGPKRDPKEDWFATESQDPLPLDQAIRSNQIDEVRRLLENGANPSLRWSSSGDRFPLQEVLDSGGYSIADPEEAVRLLLKHGADPNAKWCPYETRGPSEFFPSCTSARGMTPLNFAAIVRHRHIVEMLLAAGADPRVRDFIGRSALDYADDEIIFEMISRALFPDLKTRDQKALDWVNRFGAPTPLVRTLFSADQFIPVPPRSPTLNGYQVEGEGRMLARARTLLRIGADPNERSNGDRAPLSFALSRRTLRVARALLQGGADVNQRWCELFAADWPTADRPRHLVVLEGSPDRDPACTFTNGITPLMWTAAAGDRDAVALLLEFKADRSLRDWAGRSALEYATDGVVRQLLGTP